MRIMGDRVHLRGSKPSLNVVLNDVCVEHAVGIIDNWKVIWWIPLKAQNVT